MDYHQVLDTAELGGGNLYALAVAGRLAASGCRAPVWCGGEGPVVPEAARLDLSVRRFDQDRLKRGGFAGLAQLASVGWRMRRAGGLAHVHSVVMYGFLWRALRFAGVRTVAHVHSDAPADAFRWAFRRPPRAIVTCARFLVGRVEAALPGSVLRETRVIAVPNSVDVARFHPGNRAAAKAAVGAPADRPLVLLVANLAAFKGHRTALDALGHLRAAGMDAELWFAGVERGGGREFTAELERRTAELGLGERVRFLGQRPDVPDLMRAADAVILPSTHEGLPLTLLEAQASGTPVLAAPTAGIPEIVRDGETGMLLAADDPEAYARALDELFREPRLARTLADNALARVRAEHTFDEMFRRLRGVYDEILA
jgi:glycosyltransferase involved in cell wall biosynthesis